MFKKIFDFILTKPRDLVIDFIFSRKLAQQLAKLPLRKYYSGVLFIVLLAQLYIDSGHCGSYCGLFAALVTQLLEAAGIAPEQVQAVTLYSFIAAFWRDATEAYWTWTSKDKPIEAK